MMRTGSLNYPNTFIESTNPNLLPSSLLAQFPAYKNLNLSHIASISNYNNQLNMNSLMSKHDGKQQIPNQMENPSLMKKTTSSKLRQQETSRITSPLPPLNYDIQMSNKKNSNANNDVIIIKDDSNEKSETGQVMLNNDNSFQKEYNQNEKRLVEDRI